MAVPTLLDIAKANGSDAVAGLIEEAAQAHPEIGRIPARTIRGTNYKTLVRTSVPTGNSFRDANDGTDPVKSGYENRLVETYIFDKRFEADKAVADRFEDGWEAYLALEASGIMEGGMQDLAKQFYYGTNATFGNASGFPGLLQALDANVTVDAGGTTDNVASSVWAVKFGAKDVIQVVGSDGAFSMSDVRVESITGSNDKKLDGYVQTLLYYPGLQVGHRYSVGRIKKLTTDSGKGLTDDLLGDLLSKFEENRLARPDAFFLHFRSLEQLRQSRTATNATGAPAPRPTEYEGIPLLATSAISKVETLAL